jgi:hypothetical protein
MDELRDIRGINYIDSIWPLAPGWQLIIASTLILTLILMVWGYKKYKFLLSWEHKILKSLDKLKKDLESLNAKQVFEQLSHYLRMILIKEYGRSDAASKSGKSMLILLEERDPQGFKWTQEGGLLTSVPYMPKDKQIDKTIIIRLIEATKNFVQVPHAR